MVLGDPCDGVVRLLESHNLQVENQGPSNLKIKINRLLDWYIVLYVYTFTGFMQNISLSEDGVCRV